MPLGAPFQSTPPARGATLLVVMVFLVQRLISIHAPREGGDRRASQSRHFPGHNFNPRPPRGGRLHGVGLIRSSPSNFNPRPPRGGRRPRRPCTTHILQFQSTPPARGATYTAVALDNQFRISIHAPREGGDRGDSVRVLETYAISIHAPREGGDCSPAPALRVALPFQSTPPARGATTAVASYTVNYKDFNPRPPRGGRLWYYLGQHNGINFNPRPPRGGRRQCRRMTNPTGNNFNPRPPRGGRQQRCTVLPVDL